MLVAMINPPKSDQIGSQHRLRLSVRLR